MHRSGATADVFQSIACPTRRTLLDRLTRGECSVSELVRQTEVSQPAVSQQLRVLKAAGLVSERRDGRHRVYQLKAQPLQEVMSWITRYEVFWTNKLDALGDHLDRRE